MQANLPSFPTFDEWMVRALPDGGTLFERMVDAFYVIDPDIGISENAFLTRLLQQVCVPASGSVSCDHTHDAARNFNDKRATNQFNVSTGDYVIAGWFITQGTGMNFILHAIEFMNHRPGFDPGRNYLDTWPNSREVWEALWPLCI